MSNCELFHYSGIGQCKALRSSLIGFVPIVKGTTLTHAKAAALDDWKTDIIAPLATSSKGLFINIKRGYEVTTDEPEMTSSNLGFAEKTRQNPPKITGYAFMSYADYKQWFGADGKEFELALVTEDGNVIGTNTSADLFKGFRGRIFIKIDAPRVGADLQQECKFDIIFDNLEEWKNFDEVVTDFTVPEFEDLNPVGVDLSIVTAYAAGDVTILATYRGEPDRPYVGLTAAANFEVLKAYADVGVTIAVDDTDAALGVYVLTIQNGTPANLAGNVIIQGVAVNATEKIALSNPLLIKV